VDHETVGFLWAIAAVAASLVMTLIVAFEYRSIQRWRRRYAEAASTRTKIIASTLEDLDAPK
jgi:hypothetical protein